MMLRAPAAIPMRRRRRIYATVLAGGVLFGLAWGVGSLYTAGASGQPVPNAVLPAVSFLVTTVLGLLWLRPQPFFYALGLCSFLLAFGGPWVAVSEIWRSWPVSGYQFAWLSLLLPVAWLLLAVSIGAWKLGLVSYLLVGLMLVLMIVAGGLLAPSAPGGRSISSLWDLLPSRYVLPCMWLLWPYYALRFLNAFVWLPPCGA
jgi:hypothetical protein